MSRILNSVMAMLVVACMGMGCSSPYAVLKREQVVAIDQLFGQYGARHQLTPFCTSYDAEREITDLERAMDITPQRLTYPYLCRFLWMDSDSVYRTMVLVNSRDEINTTEQWAFGAIVQREPRCQIYRLDTLFARSNSIRTFYDSIPSYLEQALRWTTSKQRSDLPLVCSR